MEETARNAIENHEHQITVRQVEYRIAFLERKHELLDEEDEELAALKKLRNEGRETGLWKDGNAMNRGRWSVCSYEENMRRNAPVSFDGELYWLSREEPDVGR